MRGSIQARHGLRCLTACWFAPGAVVLNCFVDRIATYQPRVYGFLTDTPPGSSAFDKRLLVPRDSAGGQSRITPY